MRISASLLLAAMAVSGCASYKPLELSEQQTLLEAIPHLTVDPAELPLPHLAPHAFSASADGLDMTDVAILAVVNNPDLKLARNDAAIARAQSFMASLLPDPQLGVSQAFVTNVVPDSGSAFSIGPSFDFGSLITRPVLGRAAKADANKADLTLLWQEWQVIAQSRVLFVKLVQSDKLMSLLQRQQAVLTDRYRRTQTALDQGLVTLDLVTPNLTSMQDINRQINDLERSKNQLRHDLNALLGLAPQVVVPLRGDIDLAPIDQPGVQALLPQLSSRRPDLMALRRGYEAQDQRYRAAILAQFPPVSLGITRARDNSHVYTQGYGLTISLPLFNRNRGNIAVEEATRQKLHDEYSLRIDVARSDVDRLLSENVLSERQLGEIRKGVSDLGTQVTNSRTAFRSRNIDALALATTESALLAKQVEELNLEQTILEQRVGLQTVLGGDIPSPLQGNLGK